MSEREKFEAWYENHKPTLLVENIVKGTARAAWQAARADLLEDMELNKLADAAKTQKRIAVNLEDL